MSSGKIRSHREEKRDEDSDCRRVEKMAAVVESVGRDEIIQSMICWRRGFRRDWRRVKMVGSEVGEVCPTAGSE
jgi:hypothetical protein